MEYRNFDLVLFDYQESGDHATYRVHVAASPAADQFLSEAEPRTLPTDLGENLRRLDVGIPDLAAIVPFGNALADLLFPPKARDLLMRSRAMLGRDEGLRIRLKLESYALADLPWEYVYVGRPGAPDDTAPEGFLALDHLISIVRYELQGEAPGSLDPVDMTRLRMVMLMAGPDDPNFPTLNLDAERDYVARALKEVPGIHLDSYADATVETLEDAMTQGAHIFHFSGHGGFEGDLNAPYGSSEGKGYIVLLGENRRALPFPAERLALNLADRGVRLAVLGACESGRRNEVNPWSGVVPALARARIPAVVGMQFAIYDTSALAFSRRFYRALAAGQPVDAAVADGRLGILNRPEGAAGWGAPVLYLRTGEGLLFPRPRIQTEEETWPQVVRRSLHQTGLVLRDLSGTADRPGVYIPQAYQPREATEAELEAFLQSPAQALILIGDTGIGKTNLLCRWTVDLQSKGNAVFYYPCGGALELDVAQAVAQDLSLKTADDLLPALERIAALAASEGKQFVLIFDAINAFRGPGQAGPEDLLKSIDGLVGHLPEQNVRVVLSCNTAAWKQLQRQDATNLFWSRYYRTSRGDQVLALDLFTPPEFESAFPRYRDFFQLQSSLGELPLRLAERLRVPLLLRMVAEAYRGRSQPIVDESMTIGIYRRYYDERVRRPKDRLFADELAVEMRRQGNIALRVDQLGRNPAFRDEIVSEEPDAAYRYLLDAGILTETPGALFEGDLVRFTYGPVAAYVIARQVLAEQGPIADRISALVREARNFPLTWDAARTLLFLSGDTNLLTGLAQSTDVELRELAVEALIASYGDRPGPTIDLIKAILQVDSEEARRSGLKAAYRIGTGAREAFLWAAAKGSPALRQAAKYTLYFIWRTDPDFTFDLLRELIAGINLGALLDLGRIVEFAIDLPTTIFINHCERPELAAQITDLHYSMIKEKLHIDLLFSGFLGQGAEEFMIKTLANSFSRPMLDSLLFTEVVPPDTLFAQPPEQRAILRRVKPFFEPGADLTTLRDDLVALLTSDILLYRILGTLLLAVHAYAHFDQVRGLITGLFDELPPASRIWILFSFTVLIPGTPPGWVELLEQLTCRFIRENRAFYYGDEPNLLSQFDLTLLPLGLAYGKRGTGMPYLESLIRDGIVQGDWRQAETAICGLGAIGFYYPQAVFQTLRAAVPVFDERMLAALLRPLSTMRMLYFDQVDIFLRQVGAGEAYQRSISQAENTDLVRRYISWLGLYNNTVNSALFHPRIRRQITMATLDMLADAKTPQDLVTRFTLNVVRLSRETDFRLSEWVKPE